MSAADRSLAGDALAAALRDSRATTFARVMDLDDAAWRVPRRAGLNPIAWELGHLAWFAEFWILRGPHAAHADGSVHAGQPPIHAGADAVFDSARLAHAARWSAALPSRDALMETMDAQLDACIAVLSPERSDDAALYFHRLALFHEDMHGEAFAWMRSSLGMPAPPGLATPPTIGRGEPLRFDAAAVEIGRARHSSGNGSRARAGFAFDNEQPSTMVRLDAFAIDSAPLRATEFMAFVDAGGYGDAAFWPGDAGAWRARHALDHPARWRRGNGGWEMRWFDRWIRVAGDMALVHVTAWEAEAYCRWAGRRLPAAAEWELAAADPQFTWGGSVWEWTADAFTAYPGFEPGPYRDYSQPWFGDHRELRGGSTAAHARLHDRRYRNFFTPERSDVFAGFRTAARST